MARPHARSVVAASQRSCRIVLFPPFTVISPLRCGGDAASLPVRRGLRQSGRDAGGTVPMGITAQLAAFTADIRLDTLPPDVVKRARFLLLDLVGNIVRARHDA